MSAYQRRKGKRWWQSPAFQRGQFILRVCHPGALHAVFEIYAACDTQACRWAFLGCALSWSCSLLHFLLLLHLWFVCYLVQRNRAHGTLSLAATGLLSSLLARVRASCQMCGACLELSTCPKYAPKRGYVIQNNSGCLTHWFEESRLYLPLLLVRDRTHPGCRLVMSLAQGEHFSPRKEGLNAHALAQHVAQIAVKPARIELLLALSLTLLSRCPPFSPMSFVTNMLETIFGITLKSGRP